MKTTLGWLAYGLGLAFAIGQYVASVQVVWFPERGVSLWVAFLGFGMPMGVLGCLVAGLWSRQRVLQTYLGWTATGLALLWGVTLLLLVGTWSGMFGSAFKERGTDEWFWHFTGFLVAMIVCGTGGVSLLSDPVERDSEITIGDTGRAMHDVKVHRSA